ELLAALPGDVPSYRPPLQAADLGIALGIVRGGAKLPKHFATALQGSQDLGTKPLGRQTPRIESVEPDGPPPSDLRVERERHRVKGNSVARGRLAVSLLELVEQVRRNDPSSWLRGGHQADALELAQAASREPSVLPLGVAGELVDAAVGGGDVGEVGIDRLHSRLALRPERDQVSDAQSVGHAGGDRQVVGIARGRLDHGVKRPSVELVAQALADDAPDDSPLLDAAPAVGERLTGAYNMEALGVATVQGTVHLLEDVAPLPELAQAPLPVFGQPPAARRDPVGKAKTLELPETPDQQRRLRAPAPLCERLGIDAAFGRRLLDLAVERGEALLGHLSLARPSNLDLEPRPQALGRELLGGPAKAPGDVGAIHSQLPALAADAADDDVRMRVVGVVVVDRGPLEGPSEVDLDALHQLPDVVGEVEIAGVFRRHDEPELVALAEARLLEGLAGRGALGAVEHAPRAVLLDAVALDVP